MCVVMLSDARHMTGGETELMKGDGSTLKVKAPQMVSKRISSLSTFTVLLTASDRAVLSSSRADISPTQLRR